MDEMDEALELAIIVVGGIVVIVGGFAAIFGLVALSLQPFEWDVTGDGQHTGRVTAIEKDGWVWSTITVYFKTDAQSSQEDNYCVRPANANLVPILREASSAGTRVTITYENYKAVDWAECNPGQVSAIIAVKVAS